MKRKREINLIYNALPYTYNIDEIKFLSYYKNECYTVGFLKKEIEIPIAIIGLPLEFDLEFLDIKFSEEQSENIYKFIGATPLERDYSMYIVYPYQKKYEDDKELQRLHNLVITSRKNKIMENNFYNKPVSKKARKKKR